MWREDDLSKWLAHKVEEFQYPPRMIFNLSYDEKRAVSEKITFTLHLSGIQETMYSKNCDNAIPLRAKSSWFTNSNHLSKCVTITCSNTKWQLHPN